MADFTSTREMLKEDVPSVLEVMKASLGETPLLKRTSELFSWKHFDNPFGTSIILVAEAGDRIVGLRAFMRWDLVTPAGHTVRCVRAVDTATHPDFQRRGLFRRLTEEALEVAATKGIDLVFNTPNPKSGAGYLTMGWQEVGRVRVLARPSWRLIRRTTSRRAPDDGSSFVAGGGPVRQEPVQDRCPLGLRTHRDSRYWQWRFISHPTARYYEVSEPRAIAIVRPNVRNKRRELVVSEIQGAPIDAMRLAVRASRAQYIGAWFSPGSPERRASLRHGLLPLPGVRTLTLMARPLIDLGIDVTSMNTWDLSVSDLELL